MEARDSSRRSIDHLFDGWAFRSGPLIFLVFLGRRPFTHGATHKTCSPFPGRPSATLKADPSDRSASGRFIGVAALQPSLTPMC
jgi:hypothetical protein